MKYPEIDRNIFFKGWPKPEKGYLCNCRPDGDYGPIYVAVIMADGREFSNTFTGVMRSPYSPDVMQINFETIKFWDDGTPMSAVERRKVAMIIVQSYESQLYADENDVQEKVP